MSRSILERDDLRDSFSLTLKWVVYILRVELARRALVTGESGPSAKGFQGDLGRLSLQLEDGFQRINTPHWVIPTSEHIREIADQIWQATSSPDEVGYSINRGHILELVRLWGKWDHAKDKVRLHLESLVRLERLPGSCQECLKPSSAGDCLTDM